MGGSQSKPSKDSPLDYMLSKWPLPGVQRGMPRKRFFQLCTQGWPALGTDWPEYGSFDIPTHLTPLRLALENQAPGQMDYWFLWDDEDIHPMYCPQPRPPAVAAQNIASLTSSSATPESKIIHGPKLTPATKSEDITTPEPTLEATRNGNIPIYSPHHTRKGAFYGEDAVNVLAPLRTIPVPTINGEVIDHYVHIPFTTADLMNWQSTTPRLRDDPDVVHRRFRAIFQSHDPDWQDVGQLLDCLLRTEEKERVLRGAREAAETGGDGRAFITLVNPTQWNPNNPTNIRELKKFLDYILIGIKQAGERTLDWSKVHNTVQGKEEHPSDFYERLCKAFCIYTNIDPKAADTQSTVRLIFISQSAPDIKKRLQRLEGSEGKSLEELVSVATRVYHTRENIQETKQVRMLAALVNAGNRNEKQGGWRRPPKWQPKTEKGGAPSRANDMCNYCKQLGHWRRECPNRRTGRQSRRTDCPQQQMAVGRTDAVDSEE
uniref:CCHC-type domain-containing protein n=1 Tax=Chelydra serpentina TaxID=8475 RepID=A0A8C3S4Z7_CHESE